MLAAQILDWGTQIERDVKLGAKLQIYPKWLESDKDRGDEPRHPKSQQKPPKTKLREHVGENWCPVSGWE